MAEKLKQVVAYTDGACIGNPGPGGYGVVLLYGQHRKELSGGFRLTTNNRMEIMAAIVALQALKTECEVTLYTDSRYLADAMSKGWVQRWRSNGWKKTKKGKALNQDLWQQLLDLCAKHKVEFKWIQGHSGNPENERCDTLSMQAAMRKGLLPDVGYKNSNVEQSASSLLSLE
jgi:ribonuclease HI